jgi:transcriptional regulator with XRE-family HTH domain
MSEEFDLDAALTETMKGIQERESAGEGVPSTDAPPSVEAQAETPQASEERPRAPDGKFASKTGIAEQTPVGEKIESVPDQTVTQGINPPTSWSADAKAQFAALPLPVKEAIAKREMEADTGISQYREKSKGYESLEKVFAPVMPQLQQLGMSREQYVSNLMAAESRLNTDPVKGLQWLAQSLGVDLSTLTSAEVSTSPDLDALRKEVTDLRQWRDQSVQARQQAEQAELSTEISKFASDPKNEFYEQVRKRMGRLLKAEEATTLSDAYEQACLLEPGVRQIIQARALDTAQKQLVTNASQKAQSATKAAGTLVKGNGAAIIPAGNWEDTLKQQAGLRTN